MVSRYCPPHWRAAAQTTAVMLLGAAGARAQAVPEQRDTSRARPTMEATMVKAAELEGAQYERSPLVDWIPPKSFATANGSAERRCMTPAQPPPGSGITVGSEPIRSGDFVIGGTLAGSFGLKAGAPGKIWWAPRISGESMELQVSARSITNPGRMFTFTSRTTAFGAGQRSDDRTYFFPSTFTLPEGGRWLLVATSGPNWGCFILTAT